MMIQCDRMQCTATQVQVQLQVQMQVQMQMQTQVQRRMQMLMLDSAPGVSVKHSVAQTAASVDCERAILLVHSAVGAARYRDKK